MYMTQYIIKYISITNHSLNISNDFEILALNNKKQYNKSEF